MGKTMCSIIPRGSCPKCGHSQFIVLESNSTIYLTDRDGSIIDSKDVDAMANGICCRCGSTYDMLPTSYGFIPMTALRKIIFVGNELYKKPKQKEVCNPMEMKINAGKV